MDNSKSDSKLLLRRYFLTKYHQEPFRVMDCCQGEGLLWSVLRREYQVSAYWPMDLKTRKGRMKVNSARVLAQGGWAVDVVDVDTYGVPWAHWQAIVETMPGPVTVFLTIGSVGVISNVDNASIERLGIKFSRRPVQALLSRVSLSGQIIDSWLSMALDQATVIECMEAPPSRNSRGAPIASYIGIRMEPK